MAELHNCRINVTHTSIKILSIVSLLLKHSVSEIDFDSVF